VRHLDVLCLRGLSREKATEMWLTL
jgi:hypothetical protein